MAVNHGHGKTAGAKALIFAYDTGDTRNSYKGEPTTNLFSNPKFTNHTDVTVGTTSVIKQDFGDGRIGIQMIQAGTSDIAGFSMGSYSAPVSAGTYTWSSFIHSTSTGGKVKAQVTVYVNGVRHWLTSSNTWSTSVVECNHLFIATVANQWHRIENQFTLPTGTLTNLQLGSFYRTTSNFTIKIANAQLELKSHTTQFTEGTRSATEGLKDLAGNHTIDLTNAGFNSNAEIDLDGTSGYLETPVSSLFNLNAKNFSIETVFYGDPSLDSANTYTGIVTLIDVANSDRMLIAGLRSGLTGLAGLYTINDGIAGFITDAFGGYTYGTYDYTYPGKYTHLVYMTDYTNSTQRLYINGELYATKSSNTFANQDCRIRIGRTEGNYYLNGKVDVVKFYNKALTAGEVKTNYNNYKGRFNI